MFYGERVLGAMLCNLQVQSAKCLLFNLKKKKMFSRLLAAEPKLWDKGFLIVVVLLIGQKLRTLLISLNGISFSYSISFISECASGLSK